ncbi:MAG: hypothetical protein MJ219_00330 [Mycoplasmoidaceae bacterium]|nr:hypothetical protein [Mycoplasmoidaceae bacterium]
MAVTVQDLLNDPRYKDNKSLLLLAKPDIVVPRLPKKKKQKSRLDRIEQLLTKFIKRQEKFNKKQEKFNSFVMQQFKAHG